MPVEGKVEGGRPEPRRGTPCTRSPQPARDPLPEMLKRRLLFSKRLIDLVEKVVKSYEHVQLGAVRKFANISSRSVKIRQNELRANLGFDRAENETESSKFVI